MISLFEDTPNFLNCLGINDGFDHISEDFHVFNQHSLFLCQWSKNRKVLLHMVDKYLAQLLQALLQALLHTFLKLFLGYELVDRRVLEQIFHCVKPFFEPLDICECLQNEPCKAPTKQY